ncbi:MAG: SMI1/KNR4 family protein, partial [Eubacteriales bacterium]|nr:SMI1/KNR4 family protein [Eubacteriales bacterium]
MKKVEKYYKRFLKELSKYKQGVHALNVGISEEEITKFEDLYNINLPHYYREWLKLYNGGKLFSSLNGSTLAGIRNQTFTNGKFEIADNFNVT